MGLKLKKKLSSFQLIFLGFASVILVGAILLMLPISTKTREVTPFIDSLFTSTSAVCVTGLVIFDTATHWSIFGQTVILMLIQIGGMGVVTVAASFALLSGRRIGLFGRGTMQEAISAPSVGGIVRLTGFIIKGIFALELAGALLLLPWFCMDFGARGIWMAMFHSISAFCNAGFDIMGGEFSSLTSYVAHPTVNVTLMLLIVIGGIGFLTWEDVVHNKLRISKYRMQTKVILLVTALLILLPTLYFFFFEFSDKPLGERLLASMFQAITPRTAGFNTVDLTGIGGAGQMIIVLLMITGGSPGSTAGGIKTTTLAVLISSMISVFRKQENAHLMRRRIGDDTVKNAVSVLMMYLMLFVLGGIVISISDGLPIFACLFEAASAVATVGLSLGITPTIGSLSKAVLMALMFFGRVGGLTLVYAAIGSTKKQLSKLPLEKISVG